MELPTYTSIFVLRRKLYAIYDWELPRPVEMVQIGVFAVGVLVVWLVTRAIGVGFSASTAWAFVVPPAALAWWSTQPVADEKGLGPWLASQVRFLCEPRKLAEPGAVSVGDPAVVALAVGDLAVGDLAVGDLAGLSASILVDPEG
ncbi:MAG: TcpE family conjugal transfer membrane protein [Acidimicrobiales bacterium]